MMVANRAAARCAVVCKAAAERVCGLADGEECAPLAVAGRGSAAVETSQLPGVENLFSLFETKALLVERPLNIRGSREIEAIALFFDFEQKKACEMK
jgi:hypothetical protein